MTLFTDLVPDLQHSAVDWLAIEESFEWFRRLKDCPQDNIFHAEGDVQIHTKMVVDALLSDPAWQALTLTDRQSVFWAALLHDVAKPECTRTEPDGRIIAPGHSRRGQVAARIILSRMSVPYTQRETICHMITHHQAPFFLIDREKPVRRAHLISHQTRCDLLTILARSDANGRICADRERLIDNVALFGELCREQQCLTQPRQFPSDHSRFLYFHREDRAADYKAFDDWDMDAILMSGLPGAGKDTWIADNVDDREVISLDNLRLALSIDPGEPQGPVISAAKEKARELLRARRPFIWNATNLSRQIRTQLIDLLADYRCRVRIVYVETEEAEADRRNRHRSIPVPPAVIAKMRNRWEPPDLTECHELTLIQT